MIADGLLGRSIFNERRCNKRSIVSLIVGLVIGFCVAELFAYSSISKLCDVNNASQTHDTMEQSGPEKDIGTHEHSNEDKSVAEKMYREVRVLCWVMTNPNNHKAKALHVKRTWGKRCNKLLFMSSAKDEELDSVALPIGEGRNNLWGKTKEAYKYIYEHHRNDADWFLKADDDTYIIVENMRYMLYPYNPDTPVYFGAKFKPFVKQGYMSGGAGYVLSREAVRRFVVEALPNPKICRQENTGAEDVEIGKCLENVKVVAGDSRDAFGRGRFFPFIPEHHLRATVNKKYWYWQFIYYETDEGLDGCSDYTISFHYVTPNQMYVLDYFIYHLRPYGIVRKSDDLPKKLALGELMPPPKIPMETQRSTEPSNTTEIVKKA